MSAQTAHIGAGLGVIAVVTGIAGTAMIALGAPRWAWAGFGLWGVVWLIAALSLSDGPTRGFLAGTLRKSNFTQIYATLMRRNVMGIWTRLCDPAPDSASAPALFRAALTWRLYDFALRLAVAYPILLLVGQWVVTGAEGRIGSFVVLSEAAVWPERAVTVAIVLILTGGVVGYRLTSASQRPMVRKAAGSLVRVAIAGSLFFVAVSGIFLFAVAVASTVGGLEPGVGLGVGVASISVALAAPGIVVVAVAAVCAGGAIFAFEGAGVIAVAAGGFAFMFGIGDLEGRGKQRLARLFLTAAVIVGVIISATTLNSAEVPEDFRSLFLFLAVLPLINALFDVVSYAVTLSFIRRGLRAKLPFLWGLADLAIACGLLLGLGAVLVAVIHGLNLLAGAPFLDLPALFAGVRATPGAYWWLYLMLFSTLVPTFLHALLSLLGVQGVWPKGWRGPVAGWVAATPQSPLHAVRASFALSVIWALPLLVFGAVLWALWLLGGPTLMQLLGLYLDGLTWIAEGPIDAL